MTEFDVHWQTFARWLALTGFLGLLSSALLMASRVLPFPVFMALCGVGGCGFIALAFAIDAARARRH